MTVGQSGPNTFDFEGSDANHTITGSLSSVGSGSSISLLETAYADLTLTGTQGFAAYAVYSVGTDATLRLLSNAAVAVNPTVNFAGSSSLLQLGSGVDLTALRGVTGFQPGAAIDLAGSTPASASYLDASGSNTGGLLRLLNGQGSTVSTISIANGDYVTGNFHLTSDGNGGTLVSYATAITGVTASPGTADLRAGATVIFRLATTDALTVSGGTPVLTLNDGAVASYSAANSTPTSLAFTYTVASGENTPDLAVTGIALNGATLSNAGNSFVDLSGAIANPDGTLTIDTIAPTLSAPVTNPTDGALGAGRTVQLAMAASESVTVSGGTPSLSLNDGGIAIYSAALSTPTSLVFVHTVASGENTSDLAVTGASLNGAQVVDGAGNAASLSPAVGNPSGTLVIDTTAPTVTGVNITPSTGTLGAGQTATIAVGVSETVSVAGGTPTLALSDGGVATYDPVGSTPTTLVFTHIVQAGQNTSDLAITGAGLNGASITDAAGNPLDLSLASGNPAGVLQVNTSGSGGSSSSGGTSTGGGSNAGTASSTIGVYRFYDTKTGTHFFTADATEKNGLLTSGSTTFRPDLLEETNGFGAIDPAASDPNKVQVYRFFDTIHGTHFFTADQTEANALLNAQSPYYRPDLVFEPQNSFYEHSTQQAGDVPVYRFFDSKYGTHFYTGDATEYAAITTKSAPTYRADLVSEGVGFYAPSGTYL